MVLHDPVTPGTDAYHAHLQHGRLGIRRLRQRHPLRRLGDDWPIPIMSRPAERRPRARDRGRAPARGARLGQRSSPSTWARRASPGTRSPCAIPIRTPAPSPLDTPLPEAPELQGPSAVSMGNPHAIFWVEDAPAYDLAAIGPVFEHDPVFPERANISLRPGARAPSTSSCASGSAAPARPAPAAPPPARPSWRPRARA